MSDATTRKMITEYFDSALPVMFLSGLFQSPSENFHSSEEVKGAANMKKWKTISVAIRDDMQKVALTIKKQDVAGAKKLLGAVEKTCETCHDMRED